MSGTFSFSGFILVVGNGAMNRNGGGNGNIYGAIAVAHFNSNGNRGFLGVTSRRMEPFVTACS